MMCSSWRPECWLERENNQQNKAMHLVTYGPLGVCSVTVRLNISIVHIHKLPNPLPPGQRLEPFAETE